MSDWNSAILTKKGLNLQAKVEAGETLLNVTKIQLGSGILDANEDSSNLIALKKSEKDIEISDKIPQDGGLCTISGVISNQDINIGFYVKEMGLFATDPDEGEILYMYTTDNKPDYLPAKSTNKVVNASYNIDVAISNSELITAKINQVGLVTVEIMQHNITEHDSSEVAHTNLFKNLFNTTTVTAEAIKNKIKEYARDVDFIIQNFNNIEEMKQSNNLKSGGLIKTQGFYTAGDGGGADYVIVDDIGEDEVDEASVITLQKGLYAKLLIQDYVNVKWFGAKLDGVTDDSASFNNAVAFLKNKYKIFFLLLPDITGTGRENNMYKHTAYALFIPSGIMKINNTINFELEGIDYIFDNTVIDATEIKTEAFLLKGTTKIAYGSDAGMSTKISGCALIGEQKEANVAITFDESMVNRNITFYNMQIAGFNKQIYLKSHTYMLNFINCNCGNAKYHVYCDDDSVDFGERITFIGGCLGGFETVFYCHNQNVTFFVEACSLDYNKSLFDIENSKLFITGSFIEWNNPYYLGKLSLEKPYVSIVNSQIFYTGNTSNNELVYSTSNGTYQQGRLVLQNNKLIDLDKFPYLITDGFCLLDNNVTESVDSTNTGVCPFVQKTPPKIYLDNSSYAGGCTVTVNSNRDNLEIKTTDTSFYATFDKKIDTKKLYRFACTVETTQQINSPIFLSLSWVVIDKNNKEVEVLKKSTKNIKDILNNAIGNPTRIDDIFVTSNSSVPYTSFANTIYARATFSASDEDNVPIGTIINIKRLELAEW